jgi:hypothetical protein
MLFKHPQWKGSKRKLCAAISAVSLMPLSGMAPAQDDQIEEIVVTGIRGSLQQSLDRKRNADNFVDAITAEDIGAFPDQNLAESLVAIRSIFGVAMSPPLKPTSRLPRSSGIMITMFGRRGWFLEPLLG